MNNSNSISINTETNTFCLITHLRDHMIISEPMPMEYIKEFSHLPIINFQDLEKEATHE